MNAKSLHNKVNLILKKFDEGEKEKYYKDYDRVWKLSKGLKKGIN